MDATPEQGNVQPGKKPVLTGRMRYLEHAWSNQNLLKMQSERCGFEVSEAMNILLAIAIFIASRRVIAIAFIWCVAGLAVQIRPFDRLRTMSLPTGADFFKYC